MSNIPKVKYKDFLINQDIPKMSSKEYIPFWLKHLGYCKSGITCGGIPISGWLYWHINIFKITIDVRDDWGNISPKILGLDFRDNEYYFDHALTRAYKQERRDPLMMFGTRRFAKSVVLASRVAYKAFIFQNAHSVVIGASSADINNITKYLDEFISAKPECFCDLARYGNWGKSTSDVEIAFNLKEAKSIAKEAGRTLNPLTKHLFENVNKNEKKLVFSRIAIRNLEHGQVKSKDEMLAGITPTEVIFDEVGKYLFKTQWLALKPALATSLGIYRTVVLFVGTGGDVDMSQDAENYFLNPAKNKFSVCNPKEYKELVTKGHFELNQKHADTGLFVPKHMSLEGGKKTTMPFKDYINKKYTEEEEEELEGFTIQVTDWTGTEKHFTDTLENIDDPQEKVKEQMYYPSQPEDCFLVKGNNPFPAEIAKRTKDSLEENGLLGEYVTLSKGVDGKISTNHTERLPIKDFPFKGGAYDAPTVLLERPIHSEPRLIKRGTYIAGFDGYKINASETTDSVGSFYIFKRVLGLTGYRNQIVAHLATRPKNEKTFYRQCLLLLEYYNAELLPEYDTNLHNYLSAHNALHRLADCKSVMESVVPNSKANTNCGLPSNVKTKEHYLKVFQSYCWEEIVAGQDKDGNDIIRLGVERIHDPMLLQEIIDYKRGGNFDRIAAFGHALVWDEHLSIKGIVGSEGAFEPDNDLRDLVKKKRNLRNKNSGKYRRGNRFNR